MTSTDPYTSDQQDYIYLDIKQTTLEPEFDEYGLSYGHRVDSAEYVSVLSSPNLKFGRKYLVYCVFFIGGDETNFYDYQISDGLGSPFPDGVFKVKSIGTSGTGFDNPMKEGTYCSWFKVVQSSSDLPFHLEAKSNGEENNSFIYYAQFLTIDITDLKEDYHYFYRESREIKELSYTGGGGELVSYSISKSDDGFTSNEWLTMLCVSFFQLNSYDIRLRMYNNDSYIDFNNFIFGPDTDSGESVLTKLNVPRTFINTISVNDEDVEIRLESNAQADGGNVFYPKLFGLRLDLFSNQESHKESPSDEIVLKKCDSSKEIANTTIDNSDNLDYCIFGQVIQEKIFDKRFFVENWTNEQKNTNQGGNSNDRFGTRVSIHEDFAVVGSPHDSVVSSDLGSITIYKKNSENEWGLFQKIYSPEGQVDDKFGDAVVIYDNMIFSGINSATDTPIYFYKYDGTTWEFQGEIESGVSNDSFGSNSFDLTHSPISVHKDILVVGAKGDDEGGGDAGAAYVFRYNGETWEEESKLVSSTPFAGAEFGASVGVYDDIIIIGAPSDNVDLSGSLYIYEYSESEWILDERIVASDPSASAGFGTAVSIYDEVIVVGAPNHDHAGAASPLSGAAYVYEKGSCTDGVGWSETELLANSPNSLDYFGNSVHIYNGTVLIGSYGYPKATDKYGAVFVFEREGFGIWSPKQTIQASDAESLDFFGWSVGMYNDTIIIGAPNEDEVDTQSGAVYFYSGDKTEYVEVHHSETSISLDVEVNEEVIESYPLGDYFINQGTSVFKQSEGLTGHLTQSIPISLAILDSSESFSPVFKLHNRGTEGKISFNGFQYAVLSNKVKRYSPRPMPLYGKTLKNIYADLMVCSYTNSGIDLESSILGGFDTVDPRNHIIDGLGNKLPFRWSAKEKDYFFNRGVILNPYNSQELHRVLNLGNAPERPYPFRTDIFDIDKYNCLQMTLYDDVVISLRSMYFEDDVEHRDEVFEFYMILDRQDWYEEHFRSIEIGEYINYESSDATIFYCNRDLIKLNFTDWNLSSTEKKVFYFFTGNPNNVRNNDENNPLFCQGDRDILNWFVLEVKPPSNLNRISRHFNYLDSYVESVDSDMTRRLSDYGFVTKKEEQEIGDLIPQSNGRVRSFQASNIFNDNECSSLSDFINKSEESLIEELERSIGLYEADPYSSYYDTELDTFSPHIYFYMPPTWASLDDSYKMIGESLFNEEKALNPYWSSSVWTSSLFQEYITAISDRLRILKESLIDGNYQSSFSYNKNSKIGLYAFKGDFYKSSFDMDDVYSEDYLRQNSYEIAASDYGLLKYSDYLQVEIFPQWGILDEQYVDEDINNYIDMSLRYGQDVVDKEISTICAIFPLLTHKVKNSSSNSYLMVLEQSELLKFINRIDYHINTVNYCFLEYGIYGSSNYRNEYSTPSSNEISFGFGYTEGYIDSYPWTSDPEDPDGLYVDESLQPYLHGGLKENTKLSCYFWGLFEEDVC